MNHVITTGDLLRVFLAIVAIGTVIVGAVIVLVGAGETVRTGVRIMIAAAVLVLLLFLTGCATPVTKIQTVTVDVPVPVQPLTPAQVPVPPAPLGKHPADARDALDVALAKVCDWVAYGLRSDVLLRLSAGEKAQALEYPECRKR